MQRSSCYKFDSQICIAKSNFLSLFGLMLLSPFARTNPYGSFEYPLEIISLRVPHRFCDHLQGVIGGPEQFFGLFHPGLEGEGGDALSGLLFEDPLEGVGGDAAVAGQGWQGIDDRQVLGDSGLCHFRDGLVGGDVLLGSRHGPNFPRTGKIPLARAYPHLVQTYFLGQNSFFT